MRYAFLLLIVCTAFSSARADWLTARSFYTHDATTGQRTDQYAQAPQTPVPTPPTYRSSGYAHYRSSLQYGPSADHYHRVEQWGPPVQPYGEWRFPYRPYSVPYDQWGAPYAGLNIQPWPYPYGGVGNGNFGNGNVGNAGNAAGPRGNRPANNNRPPRVLPPGSVQPWQPNVPYPNYPYDDGEYPNTGARPRMNDSQFYRKPTQ